MRALIVLQALSHEVKELAASEQQERGSISQPATTGDVPATPAPRVVLDVAATVVGVALVWYICGSHSGLLLLGILHVIAQAHRALSANSWTVFLLPMMTRFAIIMCTGGVCSPLLSALIIPVMTANRTVCLGPNRVNTVALVSSGQVLASLAITYVALWRPGISTQELTGMSLSSWVWMECSVSVLLLFVGCRIHMAKSNSQRAVLHAIAEQLHRIKRGDDKLRNFLLTVSHEVCTPLNALGGAVELLTETHRCAELEQPFRALSMCTESAIGLVAGCHDLSCVETGRAVNFSPVVCFSPSQLVMSCLDLFAPAATNKGLKLTFTAVEPSTEPFIVDIQTARLHGGAFVDLWRKSDASLGLCQGTAPVMCRGRATLLRQTCINLISNSLRFTREGGINVTVSLMPNERGSHGASVVWIRVSVEDTGCGMDDQQRAKLFRDFMRLSPCWEERQVPRHAVDWLNSCVAGRMGTGIEHLQ